MKSFFRCWWTDLLLGSGFFLLYLVTLAPDVLPADSGEFQAVVPLLGVAHPPGFSLYTLLGKAFTLVIPFGSPAYRLNLFSALTGALTLVAVYRTVRTLSPPSTGGPGGVWPGLAAAALGVSTTFWSQSTTANIRSLTGLFTALSVWGLASLRNSTREKSREMGVLRGGRSRPASHPFFGLPPDRALTVFALALSLGIVHHASLAFIGIIFVLGVLLIDPSLLRQPRRWLRPIGVGLLPLLALLYLPWRGAAGAFLAPDHLTTWDGFLEHVLARGFEGDFFYFAAWADLPDRLSILWTIARFQFNPALLALMAFGFAGLLWRNWRMGLTLLLATLVHAFIAITYRAPQTVEYLLPAYVILAIGLGAGLGYHISRFTLHVSRFTFHVLIGATFISALALGARNYPAYAALARDASTRDYAASILAAAPPDAAVLANWHWATPMWYLQKIEGMRPDVEVIYVFPQGESLAQNWVDRLDANVPNRPTLVTSFYATEYTASGYWFTPAGPAWLVSEQAPDALPSGLTALDVLFGDHWRLHGYSVQAATVSPGQSFAVEVAWQADSPSEEINFFVQLLGPDGQLHGQDERHYDASRYSRDDILYDRYSLTVSAPAQPGDYALIAGIYKPDGIRYTNPEGGDYTVLGTITVAPRATPPPTAHRVWRPGQLFGYDYDASLPGELRVFLHWRLDQQSEDYALWLDGSPFTNFQLPTGSGYVTTTLDLPAGTHGLTLVRGNGTPSLFSLSLADPTPSDRYVPLGGSLVLVGATRTQESDGGVHVDLAWQAARPPVEDAVIKVDLIGPSYAWRAQSDHIPAGGAIPTLKWIPGPTIYDRHRLTPPDGVDTTGATLELAVYDHFTGRVLPIGDPRLARIGVTVPLSP